LDSFAFIIHPIDPKRDVSRRFPLLGRIFNQRQINYLCNFFPPVLLSEIEGVTSAATGKKVRGWLIACPLTTARMLELPAEKAYKKIIRTGLLAERLGVDIIGLGAFTSVVGDGGVTVSKALTVPVTSGNAYTISTALSAVRKATELTGIHVEDASAAVVGALGAIGRVCARLLANEVDVLYLIGRQADKLNQLCTSLQPEVQAELRTSCDLSVLRRSNLIVTVTSASGAIIQSEHLQPGSIICDVAQPRDVSAHITKGREDVLVIDGGIVDVPGEVDFNFDFGLPSRKAYACMAETMALAIEGRSEDHTISKKITVAQVKRISAIAGKHGFKLSGLRSFGRAITEKQFEIVRNHAQRR
jgi:predicted amino acid dehydrogenase